MGLFDAILQGFGVEDNEQPKQRTVIKPRRKQTTSNNKYETFNLHERDNQENKTINTNQINLANQSKNLAIFAPKTHQDIQKIIISLKATESCIVNLQNISESDSMRALDFFSGAVFALNGKINRIQGDLFLVTPKTVNIKVNKN
jgi:cell division inhibitor SepF